ncbi:MAG TPA: glucoamylase family protein [Myxococcota bacterium]|nr:glucoamylase family protein [Myxococcota bacterium]
MKSPVVRALVDRALRRGARRSPWNSEELIREELFSAERLEQHAESLALAQRVIDRRRSAYPLSRRLADNSRVLLDAYYAIARVIDDNHPITPGAEWLVDNFHVVEDQIREVRDDLPPGYYRQLPKLADGPLAGYPRVFGLAWAFVAHTDSRFDAALLCRFVRAYQRVQPLTIGELWAVAITLRIALVENLRRAGERIVRGREARAQADRVADRLLGVGDREAEPISAVLRAWGQAPLPRTFAVQLVQRLRDQDPRVTPALQWLEERLAAQATTAEELVRSEHQRQGAMNVTIRNAITSLRLISAVDWSELFESISLVDDTLRAESDFAQMDFPTRDRYRGAIEELARGSRRTELEVARAALRAAGEARARGEAVPGETLERERDPGYYLIAGGRQGFEASLAFRAPLHSWPSRIGMAAGIRGHLASIALVAGLILGLGLVLTDAPLDGWRLAVLALLGVIPALDIAVAMVNRGATNRFRARILPALELRDGIPPSLRTLVVVPTLLTTPAAIAEQIERLGVHHLASPDGDVRFALLSDWTDADSERVAGDDALLAAASAGIARLNLRYGPALDGDRFLLLHRRRIWNAAQGSWMGWERKRGKLHELDRLLRGATDTSYVSIDGRAPAVPAGVRYVITLDADTRLPHRAVRRLVGKMAHPLNQPRFDPSRQRVVEGHAVLQPRVTPALPIGREGSLFQRTFSSASGIDPYSGAVSDLYQDLLGEGSYAGKGIYDVDAFERALAGRVPENTLLSHDLFEGIFARAGLVSDIEVVEEFPARYDAAAARQHRWARGDWQLLPWILGRAVVAGDPRRSRIPLAGRWKMLDNLRRSLHEPVSFLALLAGWMLPYPASFVWTGFILATLATPSFLPVFAEIAPRRSGISPRSHFRALGADVWLALRQTALLVAFLPHQAWLMGDAVLRTLFRLVLTRRHLLEWMTAAQAALESRLDLGRFYRRMAGGVALGVVAAGVAWQSPFASRAVAAPFVLLWILSPAIARWASLSPKSAGRLAASPEDARLLRAIARRTWRFFETFVTPADHQLPPDNFQEDPKPALAHRTSPTNLGLYLLSVVSARDFGWIGTFEMADRLEATLATMRGLERHRGHFYNWYDTQDCRPLYPRYVSSVDSGNLAGHLLALANACRERVGRPLSGEAPLAGIRDALELTRESLRALPEERRTLTVTRRDLDEALDVLEAALRESAPDAADLALRLSRIAPYAATVSDIARTLAQERSSAAGAELVAWAEATQRTIESQRRDLELAVSSEALEALAAKELEQRLLSLEAAARALAEEMDFGFLFEPERKLLSIGYLVAEGSLDPSCYDLLASEARLASFVAIAKGDIPAKHWFRLGRAITPTAHGAALLSWSGSMFEYLMPSLVIRAPGGSLLEQTSRMVVRRQIEYAAELGLPWGISESAYNARDLEFTYQYSNFGVPGLGLKRGLAENAVVAPYATALATMVDVNAAALNFARLTRLGALGRYGFYEALDYTPSRLPAGDEVAIVRAFMAHHQGMTVVAIANALFDGEMRSRFHAEPRVQATELLLQERMPRDVAVAPPRAEEIKTAANARELSAPAPRRFQTAQDASPRTNLLSNGRYSLMVTAAGSGYSHWRDLAVTRWREDVTCDDWGSFVYLRDVQSGEVWSAGQQPSGVEPDRYQVVFSEERVEISRRDGSLDTALEILVSPEDDAEVRRVSITNSGRGAREIELTSYAEIVLAPPAADAAHPAFAKLFVQTEFAADEGAILATRRRRAPGEPEVWAAHLCVAEGETVGALELETDRARFIGRGHDTRAPLAVTDGQPLSNTVGTVLDPIFALRRRVRIPAGATARVAFWTLVAASREQVLDLVDKHHDTTAFERASTLAWTQAQVQLRHLGIDSDEANVFQSLGGHVLYANPSLRPGADALRRGGGAPAILWAQGISGDLPIVLLRIDETDDLGIVRELLRAHEYWQTKQLPVDLVLLNERTHSYIQDLQTALETLVRISQSGPKLGGDSGRGAVFVLRADLIPIEARALLQSAARVVLVGRRGSLAEQLARLQEPEPEAPRPAPPRARAERPVPARAPAVLEFFNGLGGFAGGGREYLTTLGAGQWTPAPWINVIANPAFGFHVSVEGAGTTWSVNSRENQLTPWSNDPVSDRPGEVFYVRDDDSGELWGPTALPIRDAAAPYVARHGQGYSVFEHTSHGIALELVQYVPPDDPIKISRLTLRNLSGRTRRLSVTAYAEWVLGASRSATAPLIVTELEPESLALLARNPWSAQFGTRVAFADLAGKQRSWTGDRKEFLGRNGTLAAPAALAEGVELSNRVGAGLDPCAALQTSLELRANASTEVVSFLGQAASAADARSLLARYRSADLDAVLRSVVDRWDEILGTVQVRTPDRSMDLMLNRWLLYQTLACRVWARSGFYQASGAYGFRDQLQDGMALATARPDLTRAHLLRAAARQFVEGDVQHWWLPPAGNGVRTRISDDRAWLAHAVAQYLAATGDLTVLDESVPFLDGPVLHAGDDDAFFQPMVSGESASLFEHCARALDQSLAVGAHGLPLIGAGDWNDSMNRVGARGLGESVWLGWFLHATLGAFAPLAEARGERARAARWRGHTGALSSALEVAGWDGDWYRRGYYDDGTPLGSAASDECRIDSIAQSWSVISGAGDPTRAARAMAEVDRQLIQRRNRLALLFAPPFDTTPLDPGYVKAYPPGIRENGGQYTHAATWSLIAFAMLGDGDTAGELFSILNPINHAATRADVRRYKVEPYALAADVYSVAPHVGRGGWTWYTGSAGWLYRAGIEWMLGFRVRGEFLELDPCVPKSWPGFELAFRFRSSRYEIAVSNPRRVSRGISHAELDGRPISGPPTRIPLADDGATHQVRVTLG